MTKFFKMDPCRMLPKDEIGFGFVLMFFSIGLSLLAKGVCLPLLLGDFHHLLSKSNYHSQGVSWTFVWFCSMILPGLLLVSWLFIFLNNQKDHRVTFPKLAPKKKIRNPNTKIWVFHVSGWASLSPNFLLFGLWVGLGSSSGFPFKNNFKVVIMLKVS